MHIETLPVHIAGDSFFTTNCYVVSSSEDSPCVVVIDPGDEPARILKKIGERKLEAILLTHGHYDHIGGVKELVDQTKAKVYCHVDDALLIHQFYDAIKEGYTHFAQRKNLEKPRSDTQAPSIDVELNDADVLNVCGVKLQVIHTPGHTQGCVCYYHEDEAVLFSGDTLFKGTCGRTDFVGSSPELMHLSLQRLALLAPDTLVLPGHDATTTIGAEKGRGLAAC